MTDSETLEQILLHLERMDRRDRLRTIGGFVRTLIAVIPVIIFLWGSWYAYMHYDELLRKVAEESAKQAAKYTQQQSAGMVEQVQKMIKGNQ